MLPNRRWRMTRGRGDCEGPLRARRAWRSEPSRWRKLDGKFHARHPLRRRLRKAGRSCPEKASLAIADLLHIRFVLCNPTRNPFAGEFARFRRFGGLRAQTGRQEQQQLLLLLRHQSVGGSFDFGKRAHAKTVPCVLLNDKKLRRNDCNFVGLTHDFKRLAPRGIRPARQHPISRAFSNKLPFRRRSRRGCGRHKHYRYGQQRARICSRGAISPGNRLVRANRGDSNWRGDALHNPFSPFTLPLQADVPILGTLLLCVGRIGAMI